VPNWKNVVKNIAESVEVAAREAQARQRSQAPQRICAFWDCDNLIRADFILCLEHYREYQDAEIDQCPDCARGKYVQYDVCLDCHGKRPARPVHESKKQTRHPYAKEHSEAWEALDEEASQFYVYILKLDGGKFYAGQTRELRERLMEHRDGTTKSTAGQNPKLVWFVIVPTRDDAEELEVELKKLVDRNPRQVRRLVRNFQDLVEELDFE
jgi:predicted GIY-YIG superfamily endonuclease